MHEHASTTGTENEKSKRTHFRLVHYALVCHRCAYRFYTPIMDLFGFKMKSEFKRRIRSLIPIVVRIHKDMVKHIPREERMAETKLMIDELWKGLYDRYPGDRSKRKKDKKT